MLQHELVIINTVL